MRQENFDCLIEMEKFQVMGFSDVLRALPQLWQKFFQIRHSILKTQPDGVILIDYPGFNLRLARSLRKQGYRGKLIQFICPSVWAHGHRRIQTLANNYDLLLTVYPFEAAYFAKTNLRVEYIGNPLIETITTNRYQTDWRRKVGIPEEKEIIALFPGSRLGEIRLHTPQQLEVARQMKARYPHLIFALSCAQESLQDPLLQLAKASPLRLNQDLFLIPSEYRYDLMKSAQAALAKSGTVSLELALHSTPSVIHYELTTLNYLVAKYFLRLNLPHYCIVNILARERLFPEFMGRCVSPHALRHQLEKVTCDNSARQSIIAGCEKIKRELSSHQSASEVIEKIMR